jgi:hypothetical protein
VRRYGRVPIYTDGAGWCADACRWAGAEHVVYGRPLRNLVERMIQYAKEGTEAFGDPFPVGKRTNPPVCPCCMRTGREEEPDCANAGSPMTQGSGGSTAPRPYPVVCHPQLPPPVRRRGVDACWIRSLLTGADSIALVGEQGIPRERIDEVKGVVDRLNGFSIVERPRTEWSYRAS